jgi:Uma2 family endonuclease
MAHSALAYTPQNNRHYTYADVLEWDESIRAEIIDGEVYMMATPARIHQKISMELSLQFASFLKGKPCEVYSAPFDVRLFPKKDLSDTTVVVPDLLVVCDQSKLEDCGCVGAPDLIIEILSPSNIAHDTIRKFRKYLAAGVREYWIVNPELKTVDVHILDSGRYVTTRYGETEDVPVTVLPWCTIKLRDVFAY